MPKVAVLSDIHANVHALRAVLADVDRLGVDRIVCCGDIVGYGPHPAECLRLVRETCDGCVMGNHDFYTLSAAMDPGFMPANPEILSNPVWAGIHFAVTHLAPDAIEWLAQLPRTLEIPGALIAHAALHEFDRWPYLLDSQHAGSTLEIMSRCEIGVAFFGHTHHQEWFSLPGETAREPRRDDKFILHEHTAYAVLVGSVGQPRTKDNRAAWTLWNSDARKFEFRKTAYPFELTMKDIRNAGLPLSSALRLGPR